jgi:hypothetical protein
MTLTAGELIEQARTDALEKIELGQVSLAGKDLEHATRHYLLAAHAVATGLREAYEVLTSEAEVLFPGSDAEKNQNNLICLINDYRRVTNLFPLLPQVIQALWECKDRWKERLTKTREVDHPDPGLSDHPLSRGTDDLLTEIASWHNQLQPGPGIPNLNQVEGEVDERKKIERSEEIRSGSPSREITGVGYHLLFRHGHEPERSPPPDEIRNITCHRLEREEIQGRIDRIDSLLNELFSQATRIAAAYRTSRRLRCD